MAPVQSCASADEWSIPNPGVAIVPLSQGPWAGRVLAAVFLDISEMPAQEKWIPLPGGVLGRVPR